MAKDFYSCHWLVIFTIYSKEYLQFLKYEFLWMGAHPDTHLLIY